MKPVEIDELVGRIKAAAEKRDEALPGRDEKGARMVAADVQ